MAYTGALADVDQLWSDRRRRAAELRERYPFGLEMLRLFEALIDVQERTFAAVRLCQPSAQDLPRWAAEEVLPGIVEATVAHGPRGLAEAASEYRRPRAAGQALIASWLIGSAEQGPVETYLARAAASPVLEASAELAAPERIGQPDDRHCPLCGGLPQLSYFALSDEDLVTGPRYLLCSRCSASWPFARMTCAGCGEQAASRLPAFSEAELFPHVRIDGCDSCQRYLLTFELRKDAHCVPCVDELAALPLDLYARDRGLTKITPNLMGV